MLDGHHPIHSLCQSLKMPLECLFYRSENGSEERRCVRDPMASKRSPGIHTQQSAFTSHTLSMCPLMGIAC